LKDRGGDIPLLIRHFIDKSCNLSNKCVKEIDEKAMVALCNYPWPGNVRELENIMERLAVLKSGGAISLDDLPPKVIKGVENVSQISSSLGQGELDIPDNGLSFKKAVDDFESRLIVGALKKTGGNKNKAATLLKLNRTTLVEKIKKKKLENEI